MPQGIYNPRVAPTMTYGVVGVPVYRDIIQGAMGLATIHTQGKKNIMDAEFKQGRAEQADQQWGEENKDRDAARAEGIRQWGEENKDRDSARKAAERRHDEDRKLKIFELEQEWGVSIPQDASPGQVSTAVQQGKNNSAIFNDELSMAEYIYKAASDSTALLPDSEDLTPEAATSLGDGVSSILGYEFQVSQSAGGGVSVSVPREEYDKIMENDPTGWGRIVSPKLLEGEEYKDGEAPVPISRANLADHATALVLGLKAVTQKQITAKGKILAKLESSVGTSPAARVKLLEADRNLKSNSFLVKQKSNRETFERDIANRITAKTLNNVDALDLRRQYEVETGLIQTAFDKAVTDAKSTRQVGEAWRTASSAQSGLQGQINASTGAASRVAEYDASIERNSANETFYYDEARGMPRAKRNGPAREEAKAQAKIQATSFSAEFGEEAYGNYAKAPENQGKDSKQRRAEYKAKKAAFERSVFEAMATPDGRIDSDSFEFLETYAPEFLTKMGKTHGIHMFLPEPTKAEEEKAGVKVKTPTSTNDVSYIGELTKS